MYAAYNILQCDQVSDIVSSNRYFAPGYTRRPGAKPVLCLEERAMIHQILTILYNYQLV